MKIVKKKNLFLFQQIHACEMKNLLLLLNHKQISHVKLKIDILVELKRNK